MFYLENGHSLESRDDISIGLSLLTLAFVYCVTKRGGRRLGPPKALV